ncbi:MAG: hypothetical protein U0457_11430 [Candidatus Sericytochromatia bacterium]
MIKVYSKYLLLLFFIILNIGNSSCLFFNSNYFSKNKTPLKFGLKDNLTISKVKFESIINKIIKDENDLNNLSNLNKLKYKYLKDTLPTSISIKMKKEDFLELEKKYKHLGFNQTLLSN